MNDQKSIHVAWDALLDEFESIVREDEREDSDSSNACVRVQRSQLRKCFSDGVSRWIPVSERLPEPDKPVLIFGTYPNSDNSRRLRARWCPKGTVEQCSDDNFEAAEYDEAKDAYYLCEGWYESNEFEEVNWMVDLNVTHWMPLPEAPK